MKRRQFLIDSCNACIASVAISGIISSCNTSRNITGKLNNSGLQINTSDFEIKQHGTITYLPYLVVRNDDLKFPICVYRFSEKDYSALWMQCAHQGAEVQVMGTYLHCPAHGSEYNSRGQVTNGPAIRDLRTFLVVVENNQIFIDLRKK